jgi:hypothetical protein
MGKPGSSRGVDYMRGFTWEGAHGKSLMEELNLELSQIKDGSVRGLVLAASYIYKKTESDTPLTPVDTGNLRSSWFVATPTGLAAGRKKNAFVGPDAAKRQEEHLSVTTEAQGEAQALTTANHKVIVMGYTASYSGWVHEMIDANFNPEKRKGKRVRREGAGAKWLESAIKNNRSKIVEIVRDNAKVK